ncbi:VCBS repeat-containing protein [Galbibacter sp. BG1]|uniref:FG-GAP repeat domain-containing protein n=1 Tax=Galbibacter sp. BG1 TaxID=1170699 RepID=UPI0015BDB7C9|nr:VCBS repeat-containing protein [Galbibacter sp. BG1]QLE01623.1 VCBS repeat-containing protein [Galbibacter sp. BG1]
MRYLNKIQTATIATVFTMGAFVGCAEKKEKKENEEVTTEEMKPKELSFEQRKIADSVKYLWAHTPKDLTGDGIADLIFINNNANGGELAYAKGKKGEGVWEKHIIAEKPPREGLFAGGDLEANDVDGDGDMDVIGINHPGEWTDASATAYLFWYENDGKGQNWKVHTIGEAPDAVKDVNFADFDNDGKMDLAILTFDEHTLSIFHQNSADDWSRVQYIKDEALHEGMDVGDVNGDGFVDIVATGFVFYNPGKDSKEEWKQQNIDEQWNNQTGDWSRNGTKAFLRDVDGDKMDEIFISHSERAGYPVVMYKKDGENWKSTIIADSIPACHTLQVFDFDLDGDYDVLTGINKGRAVNLDIDHFEIILFLNEGDYKNWEPMEIGKDGIYNGQAIDYDSDGDMDFFRYPNHEAKEVYLQENKIK